MAHGLESAPSIFASTMKKLAPLILTLILLFLSWHGVAQELCDNGIDDDNDGFVDCYDSDCAGTTLCNNSFIFPTASCEIPPPPPTTFSMKLKFASINRTANNTARVSVGDLDRDGVPEIVTMNRSDKKVFILDGATGNIKYQKQVGFSPQWDAAIANINDDNCAEIFFYGLVGPNNFLFAFDCQLNMIWSAPIPFPDTDLVTPGIADFGGDGKIEIYVKNLIYDAHTGELLVANRTDNTDTFIWNILPEGSIAVDMDGDDDPELVAGLSVFKVDLPPSRAFDSGNFTLLTSRPEFGVRNSLSNGASSVADYNQDGHLDILATGSDGGPFAAPTTAFFWDVHNDVLRKFTDVDSDWGLGTGRINIGDLDGDGKLNASYLSGPYLYALDENFNLLWKKKVTDVSSGTTGCTLFDFNDDGKTEIVFRDERYLFIINGTDGAVLSQQVCTSLTSKEYPVVVDVDADGSTELCVTCGFFDGNSSIPDSHVRVFQSADVPWVPARRVWNQHGYFVANVNDDLTIPKIVQKHHLVWSNGSCSAGPNRALNKFLNQAPFMDTNGCPIYAAPDLDFASAPIIQQPTCPDVNFTVSFSITNKGDIPFSATVPISFYSQNPMKPGAVLLNTINTKVSLRKNETHTITQATVNGIGSDSLFIVLNDAGTSIPTPIQLPNTSYLECDYDNMIGIDIKPLPATLIAQENSPVNTCAAVLTGSATAAVRMPDGSMNYADFNFYWSDGPVAKPIAAADFIGSLYSGIGANTYTVYARHKTANCSSDTVSVTLSTVDEIPALSLRLISHQTSCDPVNGEVEVVIAGGTDGYTFSWENDIGPIGNVTPKISGVPAGLYLVRVTTPAGCNVTSPDIRILDQTRNPDVIASATPVTDCTNPASGTITAVVNGEPQTNYTFDWYQYDNALRQRGSLLLPIHGLSGAATRTQLMPGYYEVEVTEKSTGCKQPAPVVVEVTNEPMVFTVNLTPLAPQTACDPAKSNGMMQAEVVLNGTPQSPSGYTFEWFEGVTTSPVHQLPAAQLNVSPDQDIASHLKGNGQVYTVRATDKASHCSAIHQGIVGNQPAVIEAALSKTDNTACTATLYNGSISATITRNGIAETDLSGYQLDWFNGDATTSPMRPEKTASISQLPGGSYTMVAIHLATGCTTIPVSLRILDNPALPTLTLDADSSTTCLPLAPGVTPNGVVRIKEVNHAAPNPASQTYQWFQGTDLSQPIAGANASTLTDQQGGIGTFYTALVTDQLTGCQNSSIVALTDGSEKPLIILSSTDNTFCNPTQGAGSLTVQQVFYKGLPYNTGIAYVWYDGVGTSGAVRANTANVPNVLAGQYSATATITSLGCTSDYAVVEVKNSAPNLSLQLSATPSTHCAGGTPNGSIAASVMVNGVPVTGAFTFQWFAGISTADPTVPATPNQGNTSTVMMLSGGARYTVEVNDPISGCTTTQTIFLPDDHRAPTLADIKITPNTLCTVARNGSAAVNSITYRGNTITAPFDGFTFSWSSGNGPAPELVTDLAAGNYTLTVTTTGSIASGINNDNCSSLPLTFSIQDSLTYPTITITKTKQTSCDAVNPNGQLGATDPGSNHYTVNWFRGNNTLPAAEITDPSTPGTISGLASGFYTTVLTYPATGCNRTQSTFVPDSIVFPALSFTDITDPTQCQPSNGEATAVITNLSAGSQFTVYYVNTYSDVTSPATPPSDPTIIKQALNQYTGTSPFVQNINPPPVQSLSPGYLTGLVIDHQTQCESAPVTIVIRDASANNQISINQVVAATFCGSAGGSIDVSVTGGAGGYTYEWWAGTPSNSAINFHNNPPDMSGATAISSGQEDLGIVNPAGGAPAGIYTFIVRDANGCGAYQVESIPYLDAPTIQINTTDPQRCGAPFDGEIRIQINGTSSDYTATLYRGATAMGTIIRGEIGDDGIDNDGDGAIDMLDPDYNNRNLVVSNLGADQYYVRIIDYSPANRPCSIDKAVTLHQRGFSPMISLAGLQGNSSCDPTLSADGQITLTVSQNPLDSRDPVTTPLTFSLESINPAPFAPPTYPHTLGGSTKTVSATLAYQFAPTSYRITVAEVSSGCTAEVNVTVPNTLLVPELMGSDVNIINESFCAPLSNGSAQVTSIQPGAISDYDFNWYQDASLTALLYNASGAAGGDLFDASKPAYANGVNGNGHGDQQLYIQAKKINGPGQHCLTGVLPALIRDTHITPQLVLSTTPDTSCDALIGEGSISVNTTTPSSDPVVQSAFYSFTLQPDPSTVGTILHQNGITSPLFTHLPGGPMNYVVNAVNEVSGCSISSIAPIAQQTPLIEITDTLVHHKMICLLDGEAHVTEITLDRSLSGLPDLVFQHPLAADFEFRWFKNTPGSFSSGTPLTDGSATIVSGESLVIGTSAGEYPDAAPSLGAGTYYVVARQSSGPGKHGAGCETSPVRIEIHDESIDPVALLSPFDDTACSSPYEGSMIANVSDASIGGPFNFNYTWAAITPLRTPPLSNNPYNGVNDLFQQVQEGSYQLVALNNTTGCTSLPVITTVAKRQATIIIGSASTIDQSNCNPVNGSIRVDDLSVNGNTEINHANFTFSWYQNSPTNTPFIDQVVGADQRVGLSAGTYYIIATRISPGQTGHGCTSVPIRADIHDVHVNPLLIMSTVNNTSCDALSPNGVVSATAAEIDGSSHTYSFQWKLNGSSLPAPLTPVNGPSVSVVSNAMQGLYEVTASNAATGCSVTRADQVKLDLNQSKPSIGAFSVTDPVDCFPTGSIQITQINLGGVTTLTSPPDDIDTDYSYRWFIQGTLIAGETNSFLQNQLPGTYQVILSNNLTSCESDTAEVTISPASIRYPAIGIRMTIPQTICDVANLGGSGALVATVDIGRTPDSRSNPGNYDIFWYGNLNATGPSLNAASDTTITGLVSGNYAVRVYDHSTNCASTLYHILPDQAQDFTPRVDASSLPLTRCVTNNGMIAVSAIAFPVTGNPQNDYPFPYRYSSHLYVGSSPNLQSTPDYVMQAIPMAPTSFSQEGLTAGDYTVKFIDDNTGCYTVSPVTVEDQRSIPAPVVDIFSPNTNCDSSLANGTGSVSVEGDNTHYRFAWYEQPDINTPVYTGAVFNNLKGLPVTYTVTATDLLTGCAGQTTASVVTEFIGILTPSIEILSDITSCLMPNGALRATVDGSSSEYIFEWYNGTVEKTIPDFVGEIYQGLATGDYTVKATHRFTGCESMAHAKLNDNRESPQLEMQSKNATCRLANGSAFVGVVSQTPIETILWMDETGAVIAEGPYVASIAAGDYSVTVTDQNGCTSTLPVRIESDIRPFNGISRNNDNRNELFYIDCINEFPGNVVKIFNRAGTLVYEGHHYDNMEVYFNGNSNRGVSPMGNNLPDGTYFYIIDKGDGSRPLTGYIEIVK